MLLQTVVENAIKHGIAELPEGGVLRISAELREGALIIEVENPRPTAPSQSPSSGVGLRNAAERLRLLFGAAGALDLDLSHPERALARIRIPQGHAV
jgi:LytS/YehU family sensor histidine kinase